MDTILPHLSSSSYLTSSNCADLPNCFWSFLSDKIMYFLLLCDFSDSPKSLGFCRPSFLFSESTSTSLRVLANSGLNPQKFFENLPAYKLSWNMSRNLDIYNH